jgi:hypothetical protein
MRIPVTARHLRLLVVASMRRPAGGVIARRISPAVVNLREVKTSGDHLSPAVMSS